MVTHGTSCCGHKFHSHCLNHWLKAQTSCPCCRSIMVGRKYSDDECLLVGMDDEDHDGTASASWYDMLDYVRLYSMNMVGLS